MQAKVYNPSRVYAYWNRHCKLGTASILCPHHSNTLLGAIHKAPKKYLYTYQFVIGTRNDNMCDYHTKFVKPPGTSPKVTSILKSLFLPA